MPTCVNPALSKCYWNSNDHPVSRIGAKDINCSNCQVYFFISDDSTSVNFWWTFSALELSQCVMSSWVRYFKQFWQHMALHRAHDFKRVKSRIILKTENNGYILLQYLIPKLWDLKFPSQSTIQCWIRSHLFIPFLLFWWCILDRKIEEIERWMIFSQALMLQPDHKVRVLAQMTTSHGIKTSKIKLNVTYISIL